MAEAADAVGSATTKTNQMVSNRSVNFSLTGGWRRVEIDSLSMGTVPGVDAIEASINKSAPLPPSMITKPTASASNFQHDTSSAGRTMLCRLSHCLIVSQSTR